MWTGNVLADSAATDDFPWLHNNNNRLALTAEKARIFQAVIKERVIMYRHLVQKIYSFFCFCFLVIVIKYKSN